MPAATRLRLSRTQRKALLVVHVASSVGWLGVSLAMLVLAVGGRTSPPTAGAHHAYWAMRLFADTLVVPLSLAALASGILIGLGTPWGLLRHRWVLTKLVLTTIATGLSIFALRPQIAVAYHVSGTAGDAGALARAGSSLLAAGSVSVSLYLFITIVSVFKPWGPTRYGRGRTARPSGRG